MGEGGDVFVLDMGEPVKIVGLARKMIQLSGLTVKEERAPNGDIEIAFTGLRAGEKLFEELLITESAVSTRHQRIMRESEIGMALGGLSAMLEDLAVAIRERDEERVRVLLFGMVESYNTVPKQKAG